MTDHYAVIGNPVAHSRSPLIHAEFARETKQDIDYAALFAPRDGFRRVLLEFRAAGGKGVNVTVPFKHDAWSLATSREGYAGPARAVNTIEFRGEEIIGHNTDGVGLVRDITANLGCPIAGRRVLLMGAGGAAYGVMETVLRAQPQTLVVANRHPEKARALVGHFDAESKRVAGGVSARPYRDLAGLRFDLVINATSAGLAAEMPPLPEDVFAVDALAYDMVYGRKTPFLEFARRHRARPVDGTGMLVEQAAESFFIWRGVRPQTAPVIALLRNTARSQ